MNVVYTTIQEFLDAILGTYTPMHYIDTSGATVYLSGVGSVDYPYIIRACVFLITMYCLYKIIGGLLCKTY